VHPIGFSDLTVGTMPEAGSQLLEAWRNAELMCCAAASPWAWLEGQNDELAGRPLGTAGPQAEECYADSCLKSRLDVHRAIHEIVRMHLLQGTFYH
jgi:hypothetical protein